MNVSTVLGLVTGLSLVFFAIFVSTDKPGVFLDLPGIAIVIGGLVAASLVSFPGRELLRIARVLILILKADRLDLTTTILRIQHLAGVVSREGLDALDGLIEKVQPPFLRDGLEMVVDQVHPDEILAVMERRIELTYEREINEAQVVRTLAKMAPSLGMLGTTVGLVTMMTHLDFSGYSRLGVGLATALTTTFYGLVLAHLVFTPLANRLEARAEERVVEMRLIAEGILLIARRVPASLVLNRLQAYVPPRMWSERVSSARMQRQAAAR
jgi:chemotaxis protein MotA